MYIDIDFLIESSNKNLQNELLFPILTSRTSCRHTSVNYLGQAPANGKRLTTKLSRLTVGALPRKNISISPHHTLHCLQSTFRITGYIS